MKNKQKNEINFQTPWTLPQGRIEIKPYVKLYTLDDEEQATLEAFLKGPQVEIYYDLDDERDYAIPYQTSQGIKIARISDCVTINGVRWHLQPGKNIIPKAVYDFLMQCPEQRRLMSCPQPNMAHNILGNNQLFKSSFR